MSEKNRQKKDGRDKNKENQAMREGQALKAANPSKDLRDEFKPESEKSERSKNRS